MERLCLYVFGCHVLWNVFHNLSCVVLNYCEHCFKVVHMECSHLQRKCSLKDWTEYWCAWRYSIKLAVICRKLKISVWKYSLRREICSNIKECKWRIVWMHLADKLMAGELIFMCWVREVFCESERFVSYKCTSDDAIFSPLCHLKFSFKDKFEVRVSLRQWTSFTNSLRLYRVCGADDAYDMRSNLVLRLFPSLHIPHLCNRLCWRIHPWMTVYKAIRRFPAENWINDILKFEVLEKIRGKYADEIMILHIPPNSYKRSRVSDLHLSLLTCYVNAYCAENHVSLK